MKLKVLLVLSLLLFVASKENSFRKTFNSQEELGRAFIDFINNGSRWDDFRGLIADQELVKKYFKGMMLNRMKFGFMKQKYRSMIDRNTTQEFINNFVKEHQNEYDEYINELMSKNKLDMQKVLNKMYGLDKYLSYIEELKQDWEKRLINAKELPLEFISIKGKPEKKLPGCDENLWLTAKTSEGNKVKFFFNYICDYRENGYKIFVDKPYFMPIIDNNEGWNRYRNLKINH